MWDEDHKKFRYPSYVQDILGPLCFVYGFGPFRWVCLSGKQEDLDFTDQLAFEVLSQLHREAPAEIKGQLEDNMEWIKDAKKNIPVVGSKSRILYADAEGRIVIAKALTRLSHRGKSMDLLFWAETITTYQMLLMV